MELMLLNKIGSVIGLKRIEYRIVDYYNTKLPMIKQDFISTIVLNRDEMGKINTIQK